MFLKSKVAFYFGHGVFNCLNDEELKCNFVIILNSADAIAVSAF